MVFLNNVILSTPIVCIVLVIININKIVSSLELVTRNCDVVLIKNSCVILQTEGHFKGVSQYKLRLSNVRFTSLFGKLK